MDNPTLIQLLDRLSKLRPDICRHRPDYHAELYMLHDGEDWIPYIPSKLGIRRMSQLKGVIERAIELERQKPGNTWPGYASGTSDESGNLAYIVTDRTIERLHQPNHAIALLGCFVEAIEGGVA